MSPAFIVAPTTCPACGCEYAAGDRAPPWGGSCSACDSLSRVRADGRLYAFPEFDLTVRADMDKQDLIDLAVRRIVEDGLLPADMIETVVSALVRRERLGTTGIGRGVGMPHSSIAGVDGVIVAGFSLSESVDFDAIDGERIDRLIVILTPPSRPGDTIRVLELITRHLARLTRREE